MCMEIVLLHSYINKIRKNSGVISPASYGQSSSKENVIYVHPVARRSWYDAAHYRTGSEVRVMMSQVASLVIGMEHKILQTTP